MVVSIRKIIVCFVIIILFFQNPLEMHMSLFKYVDEILAAGGIVYCLCSIGRKRVSAHELMSLLFFIAFVFCGLLGNILYADNSLGSIASDIFVCSKFFAVVYWGKHYIAYYLNEEISALGVMISKCLTIFILGLTIADFIFKIWDSQVRYGVKSLKLFWGHSTYLAASLTFLMMILLLSRRKESIWILIDAGLIALTLRSKAIAFSIIFVMLYLVEWNKKRKFKLWKIIPFVAIAFIIGLSNIMFYFFEIENSARSILLRTSIQIANDYFPLGVGFASFGSNIANKTYGQFYYQYGLNLLKETSKWSDFLNDSFWPCIIGQTGIIGSFFYILTHFAIVKRIFTSELKNKHFFIGNIGIYTYLLLASIAEPAFNNSIAVPLGIMLGLFLGGSKRGEICSRN